MKLLQMIIVSSTYLIAILAIMIFIQGFVYRTTRFSIYNELVKYVNRQAKNTNDRRKLKYTQIEECRKVG